MWTKCIAVVCLFSLAPSLLWSQSASDAISSVERIRQIIAELENISDEKENSYRELENINNERKNETDERQSLLEERRRQIEERLLLLEQREKELEELKKQLELFGDLIDQNAAYTRKLERTSKFWMVTSGILAVSLATTLILWGTSK